VLRRVERRGYVVPGVVRRLLRATPSGGRRDARARYARSLVVEGALTPPGDGDEERPAQSNKPTTTKERTTGENSTASI
jgi:hypothetical protein